MLRARRRRRDRRPTDRPYTRGAAALLPHAGAARSEQRASALVAIALAAIVGIAAGARRPSRRRRRRRCRASVDAASTLDDRQPLPLHGRGRRAARHRDRRRAADRAHRRLRDRRLRRRAAERARRQDRRHALVARSSATSTGDHLVTSPPVRYRAAGRGAARGAARTRSRSPIESLLDQASRTRPTSATSSRPSRSPIDWRPYYAIAGGARGARSRRLRALPLCCRAPPARRRRRRRRARRTRSRSTALDALRARGLVEQGRASRSTTRRSPTSSARYLEERFRLRAPEMTTEEFLLASARDGAARRPRIAACSATSSSESDLVKFARHLPTLADGERAYGAARALRRRDRGRRRRRSRHVRLASPWWLLLLAARCRSCWRASVARCDGARRCASRASASLRAVAPRGAGAPAPRPALRCAPSRSSSRSSWRSPARRPGRPRRRSTARASTSCSPSTSRAACSPRTSRSANERANRLAGRQVGREGVRRGAARGPHRPRALRARGLHPVPADARPRLAPAEPRPRRGRHDRGRHRGRLGARDRRQSAARLDGQEQVRRPAHRRPEQRRHASRRRPPPRPRRRSASRSTPSAPARAAWRPTRPPDLFGNKVYRPMPVDIDEDTLKKIADDHRRALLPRDRHARACATIYAEIDRSEKTEFEAPRVPRLPRALPVAAVAGARLLLCVEIGARRDRAEEAAMIQWRAPDALCRAGAACRALVAVLRRGRLRRRERGARDASSRPALLPDRRARPRSAPPSPARRAACSPRSPALVVALAGPMWGFHWQEVQREGIDLIVADRHLAQHARDRRRSRTGSRARSSPCRTSSHELARRSRRRSSRSPARRSSSAR